MLDNHHSCSSGAYLVDCAVHKPSRAAQNAQLARDLWEITEQQLADPSTTKRPNTNGAHAGKLAGFSNRDLQYGALAVGIALGVGIALHMKKAGALKASKGDH